MNEEYWKQHMEHQQRVNDEIRAFRKQRSKFIFDVYREQKRMNNPGKSDEELHIDKPFVNEINFDVSFKINIIYERLHDAISFFVCEVMC